MYSPFSISLWMLSSEHRLNIKFGCLFLWFLFPIQHNSIPWRSCLWGSLIIHYIDNSLPSGKASSKRSLISSSYLLVQGFLDQLTWCGFWPSGTHYTRGQHTLDGQLPVCYILSVQVDFSDACKRYDSYAVKAWKSSSTVSPSQVTHGTPMVTIAIANTASHKMAEQIAMINTPRGCNRFWRYRMTWGIKKMIWIPAAHPVMLRRLFSSMAVICKGLESRPYMIYIDSPNPSS